MMASADQDAKIARDTRNEEIFASRLTRLDEIVKPWLKKAAGEKGELVSCPSNLDKFSSSLTHTYSIPLQIPTQWKILTRFPHQPAQPKKNGFSATSRISSPPPCPKPPRSVTTNHPRRQQIPQTPHLSQQSQENLSTQPSNSPQTKEPRKSVFSTSSPAPNQTTSP